MKIYLGARYGRKAELIEIAKQLEAQGHKIVSGWLWSTPAEWNAQPVTSEIQDIARATESARLDWEHLNAADAIVIFNDSTLMSRGGKNVEFGIALGLFKTLYLVGPVQNVFHTLVHKHFYTTKEFLDYAATRVSSLQGK